MGRKGKGRGERGVGERREGKKGRGGKGEGEGKGCTMAVGEVDAPGGNLPTSRNIL